MAFTHIQSAANNFDGTGQATIAVSLTGVVAGRLIVVNARTEDYTGTITVSDGTSSFMALTRRDVSSNNTIGQMFYLLSSVASGSVTYTATFSGSNAIFPRITVHEVSYSGTIEFDTETGSVGTSTAPTSGNITTTGTGSEAVIAMVAMRTSSTVSSRLINGSAADGFQDCGGALIGLSSWHRVVSAAFTGDADVTLGTSQSWVANIASFKQVAVTSPTDGMAWIRPSGFS